MQQGEVLRTNSLVGSVHYLAPEVVSGESYDAMADWWAFGVLLYDMFVRAYLPSILPFKISNQLHSMDIHLLKAAQTKKSSTESQFAIIAFLTIALLVYEHFITCCS